MGKQIATIILALLVLGMNMYSAESKQCVAELGGQSLVSARGVDAGPRNGSAVNELTAQSNHRVARFSFGALSQTRDVNPWSRILCR
jgi:hypothetical protein